MSKGNNLNVDYKPDVSRSMQVKRGEIYLINLDEQDPVADEDIPSLSKTGLIAKKRPCLVISTDTYHSRGSISFRIAPIKSNNTTKSADEYIRNSYDILIPINMIDGTKFIVVNQTRVITVKQIVSYLCTLENTDILDRVDQEIIKMDTNVDISKMISSDDIIENFGSLQNFTDFCKLNHEQIARFKQSRNSRSWQLTNNLNKQGAKNGNNRTAKCS